MSIQPYEIIETGYYQCSTFVAYVAQINENIAHCILYDKNGKAQTTNHYYVGTLALLTERRVKPKPSKYSNISENTSFCSVI